MNGHIQESAASHSRAETVGKAVRKWVAQLVDLTGRNRLLYYRNLKRGTLDLAKAESAGVRSTLGGSKVSVSTLFPPTDVEPDRLDEALRSARSIYKRGRALYEERGIETLFVVQGIVAWTADDSSATPAAPLFMAPVEIKPVGAGQADFTVQINGEWRVNDTLAHYLRETFGVTLDPSALLDAFGDAMHFRAAVQALSSTCAAVPGFTVADRSVIGTFQYMKLPMVRDLEGNIDVLTDNDLVAAIAGDEQAREAIRSHRAGVSESAPNIVPPRDEYLVLDADSSQNYAINAVVAGESLVIQGPPGTGKSQTIANLIATLIARDKSVLFVAEKRAAIDAVAKRLRNVGLGDAILDLHGGITSRKELAGPLARSLDSVKGMPAVSYEAIDHTLTQTRARLVEHADQLHSKHPTWNVSVYDAYKAIAALPTAAHNDTLFAGSTLMALDATTRLTARDKLNRWAYLTQPLRTKTSPWSTTNVETRDSAEQALIAATDVAEVAATVSRLLDQVVADLGIDPPASLGDWDQALELLDDIASLLTRYEAELLALDDTDLTSLQADLAPAGSSAIGRGWARLFNGVYRQALGDLRSHRSDGIKVKSREALEDINLTVDVRRRWTDAGGQSPPAIPANLKEVAASSIQLKGRLITLGAFFTDDLFARPHTTVPTWSNKLLGDQDTLFRLPHIAELDRWITRHKLEPIIALLDEPTHAGATAPDLFDYAWHQSIIATTTAASPALATFDAELLSNHAQEFSNVDREHIASTPHRVKRQVAQRAHEVRNSHPDQDDLIHAQARRKRGHLPLRELFDKAGDVLSTLRPCWTMSPLLVAEVLPADAKFDVVIFDEASQVKPADAISAIMRARQVVVAGDDRQLPPTAFFDGSEVADDEADDDALTTGFESILDVLGALLRVRTLEWHYRSQDERLIAYSNNSFYHGSLTTFPGAAAADSLSHVLVAHQPHVADTRSSGGEINTVIDLMFDHARTRPEESLGVIAMGSHHSNRLENALQERLGTGHDQDIEGFFSDDSIERTFIKNLERVQGDERDAIILTVGYTKQSDGRLLYRFGPLNQQGGERRLNVAITRARKRVTVVSGFSHTDHDPTRNLAAGAQHLFDYLKYAETGGRELPNPIELPLNPFELSILHRLEQAGLNVKPQYGVSGYRIDFAIVHPDRPGEFVLAVEADGATYHSSATARDRDRLRQQVLEQLGWHFYRIWSTSWFRNPDKEIEDILHAVEAGRNRMPPGPAASPSPTDTRVATPNRSKRPDIPRGLKIDDYTPRQLTAIVKWIKSDTLLRTNDELVTETMEELGFQRRGRRIVDAINAAIARAQ